MWWARKEETEKTEKTEASTASLRKRTQSTPSKKSRLGSGRKSVGASLTSKRRPRLGKQFKSARNVAEEEDNVNFSSSGIEISLAHTKTHTTAHTTPSNTTKKPQQKYQPPVSPKKTVVSFQQDLISREKMNQAHFNVQQWPALGGQAQRQGVDIASPPVVGSPPNAKTGRHRVALTAEQSTHQNNNAASDLSYEDMLFLLKSHDVLDESTCIEMEIKQLNVELEALQEDRTHLEAMSLQLPENPQTKALDWEKHGLLAGRRITQAQRKLLQEKRGNHLTIGMNNQTTAKALAESLGAKRAVLSDYTADERPNKVLFLSPSNCREGGAGTTLHHISLSHQGNDESSFFFSHDHSKGSWLGRLPARLFRRMKDNGMDPKEAAGSLVFLAGGPMDYYFAEFRSGEVWWGSPPSDDSFQALCNEWDVYRVAFGPVTLMADGMIGQKEHLAMSWIILGRDGRVAWKNIPTRLHYLLQSRVTNESAIEEVALGSGDSYFIRFLDGTVDYCLPAHIGNACLKLEKEGATVTSISLHPNLPHDFVIRSARKALK
jgi:hypothetical protein